MAVIIAYDAGTQAVKKNICSQPLQPYVEDKQTEINIYENYTNQPDLQASSYSELQSEMSVIKDGFQEINITLEPYTYPPLIVQKGMPLKLIITADISSLNRCNDEIVIPDYRISNTLVTGENVIEFTPSETEVIPYSCWMGMINSTIVVVDDINMIDTKKIQEQVDALPPVGGCCGTMR